LISEALVSPVFQERLLYQNLLACVALEETIGTREPRASCVESYESALSIAALQLASDKSRIPININERVKEIERALSMV
jgi:hypothetical protein